MTRFFRDSSISTRLAVTMMLPLVIVTALSLSALYDQFRVRTVNERIRGAMAVAQPAIVLVHELQQERATTVGFIGSNGQSFRDTLDSQKIVTDSAIEGLLRILDASGLAVRDVEMARKAKTLRSSLTEIRSAAEAFSISVSDAAAHFTKAIAEVSSITIELGRLTEQDLLSKQLAALNSVMAAKERAGQERALGSAGFGLGYFDPELRDNILRQTEAQQVHFARFRQAAEQVDVAKLETTLASEASKAVNTYKTYALDPNRIADVQTVSASVWFAAATDQINQLKLIEDAIADRIQAIATSNTDTALRRLILIAFSLAVVVAALVAWSSVMIKSIRSPLAAMTAVMSVLRSGKNGHVEIPGTERGDEIGMMARTLVALRTAEAEHAEVTRRAELAHADAMRAADVRRAEDAQQAETQRLREAQEHEAARAAELRKAESEGKRLVNDTIGAALERVARGDLSARIAVELPVEFAKLKSDFNNAIAQLEQTVAAVKSGSDSIRAGSLEIAQASDDLSGRTESQAASLEETTAALQTITTTVRKTADNAGIARDLVATAKIEAEMSGSVVQKAIETMTAIERASREIKQIIGVIDEIAFQTNLLALNAGIEAARAGDAGRGFAVVASEVRALAQRSADAAKQIQALISSSTAQVDQGVMFVGQTGTALGRIIASVAEINSAIAEMATSAKDQSVGLHQVNIAIGEMDQMTQQNAAMVEQTTAATRTLSDRTDELMRLVGRFKTAGNTNEPVSSALAAHAPHVFSRSAALQSGGRARTG